MPLQPTSPVPMPFVIADPALEPETTAIIAAMTTPPSSDRQTVMNRLVAYLIAVDVWPYLDMLMMFGGADNQAALVDWRLPSSIGTENGTIIFTADRGYTGSAGHIGSGYNPQTASRGATQNDIHAGVYILTNASGSGADLGAAGDRLRIKARASNGASMRLGSTVSGELLTFPIDTFGNTTHVVAVRRDAANQHGYKQGQLRMSGASASTALPAQIEFGRQAGGATYSDRQAMCIHAGRALTDQQVMDLFIGLRNYGRAIGAVT
jgi:hypothetical protein